MKAEKWKTEEENNEVEDLNKEDETILMSGSD